jgi:hypothetical protein
MHTRKTLIPDLVPNKSRAGGEEVKEIKRKQPKT